MDYKETEWYGFKCLEFKLLDRRALLVVPNQPNGSGKWLLKTEYFGAFPNFEIEMLKRGYYLAYIANKTRWYHPSDSDAKAELCKFLQREFSLSEKCVPVGMSCGGMHAVYFADRYPEHIAALYLDAPVLNLLSCPCKLGVATNGFYEEFVEHTGVTVSELLNYRNHPIDRAESIVKNNIPVMLICGDSDDTVPYVENGKILSEYMRANGGILTEILKPNCNHHPHGLEDVAPLVEFVEKYY
ncbi:MAG: prolyl oligopeptidase family serine peptidase [Clostridia bacterium]|nr:prolyl oligopeptidase family serine peptidase [Clostridia bacterium]